jgi:hypothetical protein
MATARAPIASALDDDDDDDDVYRVRRISRAR